MPYEHPDGYQYPELDKYQTLFSITVHYDIDGQPMHIALGAWEHGEPYALVSRAIEEHEDVDDLVALYVDAGRARGRQQQLF